MDRDLEPDDGLRIKYSHDQHLLKYLFKCRSDLLGFNLGLFNRN